MKHEYDVIIKPQNDLLAKMLGINEEIKIAQRRRAKLRRIKYINVEEHPSISSPSVWKRDPSGEPQNINTIHIFVPTSTEIDMSYKPF